jgi:hypothetical protein
MSPKCTSLSLQDRAHLSRSNHDVSYRAASGGWQLRDRSPYNMKFGESIVTHMMFFVILGMFSSETILVQD